jgi:hypothetical protein
MLSAGVDSLQTMSVTFAKSGSLAAQMGSAQRYRQVIERSNSLADTAVNWKEFQGTAQSYQDPLAEAMAVWLADSHFELLTKTLPLYVAEMIEYWRQEIKKPVAEQPTSPHILAKRAKVERVRVPRLTLRLTGERILDKSLALEVATQFQGAVAEAYRLGVDQQVQAGG